MINVARQQQLIEEHFGYPYFLDMPQKYSVHFNNLIFIFGAFTIVLISVL